MLIALECSSCGGRQDPDVPANLSTSPRCGPGSPVTTSPPGRPACGGGRSPLILKLIRQSEGTAVAVDDPDALATRDECARADGVLLSPEGAVALHAARVLAADGWIAPGERVVVLNTGNPLVQPELLP